jgi:subtilisin family serine protease
LKNIKSVGTGVVLTILGVVGFQGTALAQDATRLMYSPDLVDAQLADEFLHGAPVGSGLPNTFPFNADMVNVENIVGDGEGVYVAVLDTGVLPEAPFFFSQAHVDYSLGKGFSHDIYWDAGIGDIVIGPLEEDRGIVTDLASGHGTHVASTIVGYNINNAEWVQGIAPKVTIIPVLVLDAWLVDSPFGTLGFSGGTDEMISAGIRYVADLKESLDAPVVINMSLGGPSRSEMIEEAVDYAISKGVIVVASAGNSGEGGMGYPGGLPQIISTAAAGWAEMFDFWWDGDVPERPMSNDTLGNNSLFYLEDFSSRPVKELGQKHQDLDVAAPGAWVVGPYKSAFANNTGYFFLSGTSMSAPHVSAIAAMYLAENPGASQADVERALRQAGHGDPLPADGAIVRFPFIPDGYYPASWSGGDYGTGFLNADQVVN